MVALPFAQIATSGNLTASKSADLLSTVNSLFTANSNNASDNKDYKKQLGKIRAKYFLAKEKLRQ
jgi:hypothetical protein